jgi:hypothetical protein
MKAFPASSKYNDKWNGMDLRDYFAAKIVQAMITNHKIERLHPDEKSIVIDAYILADYMMEARNATI